MNPDNVYTKRSGAIYLLFAKFIGMNYYSLSHLTILLYVVAGVGSTEVRFAELTYTISPLKRIATQVLSGIS